MIYIYAFLFAGLICAIGQIIIDNTKLTAGHVTSLFTVIGAILSFLGIYPRLIEKCGAGATVLIMNFGHMLYSSGMIGYENTGLLGIFTELLCKSSLAIVAAVVFSFVFTIFFKARD
ncbi:MAG: SpoVA/SpoVAEb family sporulation membrane protein [Firmicutes bacterium]|nr:SpoVA/SpoVAEb family sporulation membrane protein [Bacillota bacterium]